MKTRSFKTIDSWAALIDLLREEGAQACIKQFIDHKRETAKEEHYIELRKIELQRESIKRGTYLVEFMNISLVNSQKQRERREESFTHPEA